MAPQNEAPPGRAGLGELSLLCRNDNRNRIQSNAKRQAELHRQPLVERLHGLGPAPLAYFLREIEGGANIRAALETYAALPGDLIRAYGGDRFGPALHVVNGGLS